jgi:hypothetical protein
MKNMSYCAAENTLSAIRQLTDLIEDGHKNECMEESNGYERIAIKQLAEEAGYLGDLCNELMEKYG